MTQTTGLEATGLSKTFGSRRVLRDVDMRIAPGEVRGLVGQNGSGKSTLIKILSGYHAPDAGASVSMNGRPLALPASAHDVRAAGIVFVHQDLALIEPASVMENLRAGRFETKFGQRISWRAERAATETALARFGLGATPDTLVRDLPQVERALLAILRALDQASDVDHGLLVLDEPTAYLPQDGADRLFEAVRRVASSGFGVLLVTHRLSEIVDHTSAVTVLRDGVVVMDESTPTVAGEEILTSAMLGFDLENLYPETQDADVGSVVLRVRDLAGEQVAGCSFDLHAGEVLGLAGLVGMGHNRAPGLIFGALEATGGRVEVGGAAIAAADITPATMMSHGVAFVPANRLRDSGLGAASVVENLTLPSLGRFFRGGRLRTAAEFAQARTVTDRFQVQPPDPTLNLNALSGGNQQKVLLAKWFERNPAVLLLDEPTQGVDIGSRKAIFHEIRRAADAGMAILLASAELEDLAHLCDRVLVFRDGRVAGDLRGDAITPQRLALECLAEAPVERGAQPSYRN